MRSPWFLRATARDPMGELVRATDWTATPLGAPATWPAGLRAAVELCLSTRFPVLVTWGPALTMLYNDGYREILGTRKHPSAMGAPLAQVWPEVWDDIAPLLREVLDHGRPTWVADQRLVMHRSGFDEETFFTYSYSPLRDAQGRVAGLLDIASDTTHLVVEQRRVRLLAELSRTLQGAPSTVAGVVTAAVALLDGGPDVVAVQVHLGRPGEVEVVGASATPAGAARPLVAEAVAAGRVVEDGHVLVLPIRLTETDRRTGAVVLRLSPLRPVDDQTRAFARVVADTITAAVTSALRLERQVAAVTRVSDVLQHAMLEPQVAREDVATRYVPAVRDLTVGGDWYDVVELGGGPDAEDAGHDGWHDGPLDGAHDGPHGGPLGIVVGDCVGHGLEAASRMGQLRSAARALLLRTARPADVLDGLDAFARTLPGAEMATVLCGVVDPDAGTFTYSSAGHPPGVVLHADRTVTWLAGGRGRPLTVPAGPRPQAVVPVDAGDVLVLCTDGLLERRGAGLRERLDLLATVLADLPVDASPDALADELLARMAPEGSADDTVLVVHRVAAPSPAAAAAPGTAARAVPAPRWPAHDAAGAVVAALRAEREGAA
ncbi:SpoIIE family protein phosphatase [Cellulomonas sp. JZ18]|uniref:SpoIIE family protein phosphatase n=1 Tax=Cellulomonas sp. JZ18 TaxID=2654191 RepID=UPI0012D49FB0|nr:SpoIIE family protein phosphatase [Cellulomonas sp. JZ18]QGQ19817.1 SpoIIE family protein phosphatase [Cellulomonas sp. JZ18]